MKNLIFKLTFILTFSMFTISSACGTCGCKAKKNDTHSHNDKTMTNDIYSQKSNVKWKATKIGGEHEGNITVKSGHLHFEDDKLVSGLVEIDMQSIVCTDLSGSYKNKLENHLNSADFFNTTKNPTSSIELIECSYKGNNQYEIKAAITIKDITENISFVADVNDGTASAKITVDRSKFDVRYGSGSFFSDLGDNLIYDDFELEVNLAY